MYQKILRGYQNCLGTEVVDAKGTPWTRSGECRRGVEKADEEGLNISIKLKFKVLTLS